jgi:hypothetical protein
VWDPTTFSKNRERLQAGEVFEKFMTRLLNRIPSAKAALRHELVCLDLNDACKSAAKIRGSQSDGDHHRC